MKPPTTGPEVDSFYHLADVEMTHRRCRGLACFAAQAQDRAGWSAALAQWPPVYCLGKCYAAPASTETPQEPIVEAHCSDPIILDGVVDNSMRSLADYRSRGGYSGLDRALAGPPDAVVREVEVSQLRGRGGAGFPAGKKWRAVYDAPGETKYVVANADEGDHGSYIDRFIMERTPHRLIEAMAISAHAIGARHGYIYLRKEYPAAYDSLLGALDEARAAGILGSHFDLEIVIGQGSYVCGEETSLLNSIEHRRPEVRARPPFPTAEGLFGKPTLVNNVETLASVPWIIRYGGAAYAARGFSKSRGTKAISMSSLFNRPGLYEVEFGLPLRTIIEDIGGGLRTNAPKAIIIGGPLAGLIHPSEFDTPLGFEELQAVGGSVGHGGMVAFDQNTNMAELLAHVFTFGAIESCGKCTPCRLGSRRAEQLFRRMVHQPPLTGAEAEELNAILVALRQTSLCGHGSGLAVFANSVLKKFAEELAPCFP
jgi:formate dehydrogenase iron-sulfur subunit